MRNVCELVGSLTQARVQMLATRAIIEEAADDLMSDSAYEGAEQAECDALILDAEKLERCIDVVKDIRERYTRPNDLASRKPLPERSEGSFNTLQERQRASSAGDKEGNDGA